jgi:hypothetical protein
MHGSLFKRLSSVVVGISVASFVSSIEAQQSQQAAPRTIVVNLKDTTGLVDRFFDLSVGSEFSWYADSR